MCLHLVYHSFNNDTQPASPLSGSKLKSILVSYCHSSLKMGQQWCLSHTALANRERSPGEWTAAKGNRQQ